MASQIKHKRKPLVPVNNQPVSKLAKNELNVSNSDTECQTDAEQKCVFTYSDKLQKLIRRPFSELPDSLPPSLLDCQGRHHFIFMEDSDWSNVKKTLKGSDSSYFGSSLILLPDQFKGLAVFFLVCGVNKKFCKLITCASSDFPHNKRVPLPVTFKFQVEIKLNNGEGVYQSDLKEVTVAELDKRSPNGEIMIPLHLGAINWVTFVSGATRIDFSL